MSDLRVGKVVFPPLQVGTQRILRTTDIPLATAFNQAVEAIRELQVAVDALQKRVMELEQAANGEDAQATKGQGSS